MLQKVTYSVFQDYGSKNGRGECQLKIKARLNKSETSFPTNIFVFRYQFKGEEIVEHEQARGLNAMISKYIMDLQGLEIAVFKKELELSLPLLKTMYIEGLDTSVSLAKFNEHVMKYCTKRKAVTKRKFFETIAVIEKYHKGVTLNQIDIVWLKKFEAYMYSLGNSDSTVWSRMKILRALFNEAVKRDLMKPGSSPFKLYEIPEIRSRNDVLMFTEVEELELMGFKHGNERHVRDLFCFACYTGLRFSDLTHLTKDNLKVTNGVTWLQIKTQKTGAFVQIPLSIIFFGNAMRILEKYDSIEDLASCGLNCSVNRELKDMLEKANIGGGQRITMHTARRSFITSLADFGVPITTIQKLAGHSRITTTSKYLQLSTGMIQADLERAFSKHTGKIMHVDIPQREVIRITPTGRKLVIGGEFLRCKNCSFYANYKCTLFKKSRTNEDWCDSFSERLDGEKQFENTNK